VRKWLDGCGGVSVATTRKTSQIHPINSSEAVLALAFRGASRKLSASERPTRFAGIALIIDNLNHSTIVARRFLLHR
jgi:hypothetical protein